MLIFGGDSNGRLDSSFTTAWNISTGSGQVPNVVNKKSGKVAAKAPIYVLGSDSPYLFVQPLGTDLGTDYALGSADESPYAFPVFTSTSFGGNNISESSYALGTADDSSPYLFMKPDAIDPGPSVYALATADDSSPYLFMKPDAIDPGPSVYALGTADDSSPYLFMKPDTKDLRPSEDDSPYDFLPSSDYTLPVDHDAFHSSPYFFMKPDAAPIDTADGLSLDEILYDNLNPYDTLVVRSPAARQKEKVAVLGASKTYFDVDVGNFGVHINDLDLDSKLLSDTPALLQKTNSYDGLALRSMTTSFGKEKMAALVNIDFNNFGDNDLDFDSDGQLHTSTNGYIKVYHEERNTVHQGKDAIDLPGTVIYDSTASSFISTKLNYDTNSTPESTVNIRKLVVADVTYTSEEDF